MDNLILTIAMNSAVNSAANIAVNSAMKIAANSATNSATEEQTSKLNKKNDNCSEFSIQQVNEMTDEELVYNFITVTGREYLSCKHCHSLEVSLTSFVRVIRKWCLKKMNNGMNKNMSVPKTCDHQSSNNIKRQPIYRKIKKAQTDEAAQKIKDEYSDILVATKRRVNTTLNPRQKKISDGNSIWYGVAMYIKCKKISYNTYKMQLEENIIFIVSE